MLPDLWPCDEVTDSGVYRGLGVEYSCRLEVVEMRSLACSVGFIPSELDSGMDHALSLL